MLSNKKDSHKGYLLKWTNYIRGYQKRWFVLSNGLLSYYRNQHEVSHLCRGTINLAAATIKVHDSVYIVLSNEGNQTFHLKSMSESDTHQWISALQNAKNTAMRLNEAVLDDSDSESSMSHLKAYGLNPMGPYLSPGYENSPKFSRSVAGGELRSRYGQFPSDIILGNDAACSIGNTAGCNIDSKKGGDSCGFIYDFDMKLYDLKNSVGLVKRHSDGLLSLLKDLARLCSTQLNSGTVEDSAGLSRRPNSTVGIHKRQNMVLNELNSSFDLGNSGSPRQLSCSSKGPSVSSEIGTVSNSEDKIQQSSLNTHNSPLPTIPNKFTGSLDDLIQKLRDKNKSFSVSTQACVNSCTEFVNRISYMQVYYQKQLYTEREQRIRLETMVEDLAKQLGALEKRAAKKFDTEVRDLDENGKVKFNELTNVDESDDEFYFDAIEDEHMFNISLPRATSPKDVMSEPKYIQNEYESCSSDYESEEENMKSGSIARVIVRSRKSNEKLSKNKKEENKKTHRRTASSGVPSQHQTNALRDFPSSITKDSPTRLQKQFQSFNYLNKKVTDYNPVDNQVCGVSSNSNSGNASGTSPARNKTTFKLSFDQELSGGYCDEENRVKFNNNVEGESVNTSNEEKHVAGNSSEMKTAQSVPSLSMIARQTDNKNQQKQRLVPRRERRNRIPPRPNVSVNLWGIMKNCIGKELSKIPVPVNFNEPLSMLQRLTEDLEYSDCLDRASKCWEDPIEQLAMVAAFTVSSYSTTTSRTGKPFNPLLGETFECDRRDDLGWYSLAEQVSHHPPAASLYAESCEYGWQCWQEFTMSSKFRGKYLAIIPLGIAHLSFTKGGSHYTWRKVTSTVNNIIVGKLWIDNHGEMDIFNHTTGDTCHLTYKAYSYFSRETPRRVTGVITDKNGITKYVLNGTWDDYFEGAKVLEIRRDKNNQQIFETAPTKMLWKRKYPPSYTSEMYNFTLFALQLNEPEEDVAPTDSRRRPDQRLMEVGNWDEANKVKEYLEEKQREKRRCRERENEELKKEGKAPIETKPRWFEKKIDAQTGNHIYMYKGGYWEQKASGKWEENLPDIF